MSAFSRGLTLHEVFVAFAWSIGAFCFLLFWVFLRAKTKQRTLSITDQGIHTEIGTIKADSPWSTVKEVKDLGHYMLVVNRTGNAFFIPLRAFNDSEHRNLFFAEMIRYCAV